MADSLPPHDVEAEEAVIGSLIIDGELIDRVAGFLKPEHFYREKNGWCYAACLALYQRHEVIDQVSLARELADRGQLEAVGGHAYLSTLAAQVPSSLLIEQYARIVYRTWVFRQVIRAAGEIARLGYEGGPNEGEVLRKAEEVLFRLRQGRVGQGLVHIREVLDRYLAQSALAPATVLERRREGRLPTGFRDLDKVLGGLYPSDLVVLAARPGVGKSALALNVACHVALHLGLTVAFFSLEMSSEQLAQRLLAGESGVDSLRVRLGAFNEDEERRVMDAVGVLSEAPLLVDDTPQLSATEMRSKTLRLHGEQGIGLVVVDYLQLMRADGRRDNRVQEISEISRSLKGLARELDVPLLAVSQLSRAVEQRADHVPMLSDLRESGSIEQDADVVVFIHREDMYYTEDQWKRIRPAEPYPRGVARVIVAKHRNGPLGQALLYFRERLARFESYAEG